MAQCFACDKIINKSPEKVFCKDAQWVYVGPECFRKIAQANSPGYQPPKGGPRLYISNPNEDFSCCGGNDDYAGNDCPTSVGRTEHTQDCSEHGNPKVLSRMHEFELELVSSQLAESNARIAELEKQIELSKPIYSRRQLEAQLDKAEKVIKLYADESTYEITMPYDDLDPEDFFITEEYGPGEYDDVGTKARDYFADKEKK